MTSFTFLVASARANGNSEQLAKIAARSIASDSRQQWLALRELPLPPFEDHRHDDQRYQSPVGNALTLFQATVSCDHLVLVTPVYWYSVTASLKLYLDYWSHWMRVAECRFKEQMKGTKLSVISVSAGSPNEAVPMFDSLRLCGEYMQMEWTGSLLGNGAAAGDVLGDSAAIEKAQTFFA